ERETAGLPLLFVGVGIATGAVSLGILGSESRKSVTVIGHHVNLASRLQGQAKASQIIIDAATFAALGADQHRFCERRVERRGDAMPVSVYQLDLSGAVDGERS